ncbi:helix-turn-helix transcriptional regulator [Halanaerobium congolense]|uniref:helix-turn-helix transcriptional regulator n=1 Tax=Halanaerobium congolense TaxID=54121 RepID=UPI000918461F|nr:LuxR C-terminal-related transcriptional regulator [Halanaerobium congolense]SHM23841.1 regulatory protein, luxR family [Halanaerobium congolense]
MEINWEKIIDFIYKTGKIIDLHKYSYYFLKELNQLIPFYAANFFLFDEKKELIGDPVCFNINESVLKAYNDYYWQLDDIRNLAFDQQQPIISTELMDYKCWINTEYFNDFLAKNRLYYSCGIDIHADNKLLGTISLFRTYKDQNFTSRDLIYLKILAEHSSNHLKKLFEIEKLRKKANKQNENIINTTAESFQLSSREKDVLKLILQGKTNEEIANELFVSINTVKKHLSHIFNKTEVHNRTELAALVYR